MIRRWLRRHLIQRFCSDCGRPMHREMALINRAEFDPRTGKRAWVWYWGCEEGFRGYNRLYLDGRGYHDARRINVSGARRRLMEAAS